MDDYDPECTPWKALSIIVIPIFILVIIWYLCCDCCCTKRTTAQTHRANDQGTKSNLLDRSTQTELAATETTEQAQPGLRSCGTDVSFNNRCDNLLNRLKRVMDGESGLEIMVQNTIDQRNRLQRELADMIEDRNTLQTQSDAVNDDRAPTEDAVERARSEVSGTITDLENDINFVREQRNHYRGILDDFVDEEGRRTRAELRALRDNANAALENERRAHEATQTLIKEAQAQDSPLVAENSELRAQVQSLTAEHVEYREFTENAPLGQSDENSALKTENGSLKSKLGSVEAELKEAKTQLEVCLKQRACEETEPTVDEDNDEDAIVDNLQRQLKLAQDEILDLNEALSQERKKLEDFVPQADYTKLQMDNENFVKRDAELTTENAAQTEKLSQPIKVVEEQKAEIHDLKADKTCNENRVTDIQNLNETFQTKLKEAEENLASAKKDLEAGQSTRDTQTKEIEELKLKLVLCEEPDSTVINRNTQVRELTEKVEQLEKDLESANEKQRTNEDTMEEQTELITTLQDEITKLKADLVTANNKVDEYDIEKQAFVQEIEDLQEERVKLQNETTSKCQAEKTAFEKEMELKRREERAKWQSEAKSICDAEKTQSLADQKAALEKEEEAKLQEEKSKWQAEATCTLGEKLAAQKAELEQSYESKLEEVRSKVQSQDDEKRQLHADFERMLKTQSEDDKKQHEKALQAERLKLAEAERKFAEKKREQHEVFKHTLREQTDITNLRRDQERLEEISEAERKRAEKKRAREAVFAQQLQTQTDQARALQELSEGTINDQEQKLEDAESKCNQEKEQLKKKHHDEIEELIVETESGLAEFPATDASTQTDLEEFPKVEQETLDKSTQEVVDKDAKDEQPSNTPPAAEPQQNIPAPTAQQPEATALSALTIPTGVPPPNAPKGPRLVGRVPAQISTANPSSPLSSLNTLPPCTPTGPRSAGTPTGPRNSTGDTQAALNPPRMRIPTNRVSKDKIEDKFRCRTCYCLFHNDQGKFGKKNFHHFHVAKCNEWDRQQKRSARSFNDIHLPPDWGLAIEQVHWDRHRDVPGKNYVHPQPPRDVPRPYEGYAIGGTSSRRSQSARDFPPVRSNSAREQTPPVSRPHTADSQTPANWGSSPTTYGPVHQEYQVHPYPDYNLQYAQGFPPQAAYNPGFPTQPPQPQYSPGSYEQMTLPPFGGPYNAYPAQPMNAYGPNPEPPYAPGNFGLGGSIHAAPFQQPDAGARAGFNTRASEFVPSGKKIEDGEKKKER